MPQQRERIRGIVKHLNTGVGTQSTLGGHNIFARKICRPYEKNKMPEFYIKITRKNVFPIVKHTA